MKRKLMPYLLSYAFLFVSYLIISFIMAILFSFMHVSSFIYQLLITFFSYLILVVFTFIFYKMVKEKPLIHGMTLSMTYLIIQFIFHLKDINIQILIKPLFVFIIYYLLFNLYLFAYSFGFQKLLICFKLLFRYFNHCFIRNSFEGFCSDRFLCQVWSLNGDIFQVFTSGKCLCADGSNACWNNNFGQFLITLHCFWCNGCYLTFHSIYSNC